MNRKIAAGLAAGFLGAVALLAGTGNLPGASAQDTVNPVFDHGAMTLAADTATAVPTTCTLNRTAVALYNGDAANIFYGASDVTTDNVPAATTGLVIAPNQTVNVEVSCNSSRTAAVYVRSQAGTSAFAFRWAETR